MLRGPWSLTLGAVALALVGTLLSFWVWNRTQPIAIAPLDKPPEVLLDRARELLASLGVDEVERVDALAFPVYKGGLWPQLLHSALPLEELTEEDSNA